MSLLRVERKAVFRCNFCFHETYVLVTDEAKVVENSTMYLPAGWNFVYLSGPEGPVPIHGCHQHASCIDHLLKTPLGKVR